MNTETQSNPATIRRMTIFVWLVISGMGSLLGISTYHWITDDRFQPQDIRVMPLPEIDTNSPFAGIASSNKDKRSWMVADDRWLEIPYGSMPQGATEGIPLPSHLPEGLSCTITFPKPIRYFVVTNGVWKEFPVPVPPDPRFPIGPFYTGPAWTPREWPFVAEEHFEPFSTNPASSTPLFILGDSLHGATNYQRFPTNGLWK